MAPFHGSDTLELTKYSGDLEYIYSDYATPDKALSNSTILSQLVGFSTIIMSLFPLSSSSEILNTSVRIVSWIRVWQFWFIGNASKEVQSGNIVTLNDLYYGCDIKAMQLPITDFVTKKKTQQAHYRKKQDDKQQI